jgi:hypothetical protein
MMGKRNVDGKLASRRDTGGRGRYGFHVSRTRARQNPTNIEGLNKFL